MPLIRGRRMLTMLRDDGLGAWSLTATPGVKEQE